MKISTETEAQRSTKTHKKSLPVLPLSLIESEILPRVAAKSVGVCRCVCKQWKSFLSSPSLGKMHLRYHETTINHYKLLLVDGPTLRKLPLSVTIPSNPNPNPNVEFLATLDGLVCLASHAELVFWNPLTGAYRKLSSFDQDIPFYFYRSSDVLGLYKDVDDDYKLLYLGKAGRHGAYIYSHTLDAWRPIEFSFAFDDYDYVHTFYRWSPDTLWGERLYFIITAYSVAAEAAEMCSWIICFDVRTETFRKLRMPPVPDGASRRFCGSLVILNGSLHLCVTYDIDYLKHGGDMWRMNGDGDGDGDGWVKASAFCDQGFKRQQGICTATAGNWLAVLDQENNSFEKVNTEDFITRHRYFSSTRGEYRYSRIIYVETLVSPESVISSNRSLLPASINPLDTMLDFD